MTAKLIVDLFKITFAFPNAFPIEDDELSSTLTENNYEPTEAPVLKVAADGSQTLAKVWKREKLQIHYDPQKGYLSMEGSDIEKTSEMFRDLHSVVRQIFGGDLDKEIKWVETLFSTRVIGKKRPLEALSDFSSVGIYEGLSEIMGEKAQPFSLNVCAHSHRGAVAALNEVPDWYHIQIEPLIRNPKYYFEGGERPRGPCMTGTKTPAPSIISINGVVSSLGITRFLDVFGFLEHKRKPLAYEMFLPLSRTVKSYRMEPAIKCTSCREVRGLADDSPFPCGDSVSQEESEEMTTCEEGLSTTSCSNGLSEGSNPLETQRVEIELNRKNNETRRK